MFLPRTYLSTMLICFTFMVSSVIAQDALQDARARYLALIPSEQSESVIEPPEAPQEPAIVADPVPTITFHMVAQASPSLVTSKWKSTQHWLISEPWCSACPAAKRRFLAAGYPAENILSIAEAKARHGKTTSYVPYEYTTQEEITVVQPPSYRTQWPMKSSLNGTHTPTKTALLNHLRKDGPHQNKQWASWHIESWSKEQLAALHDDDHDNTVPNYVETPTEELLTADIEHTVPSISHGLGAFSDALLYQAGTDTQTTSTSEPITYGSWFNVDLNIPDALPVILGKLMQSQEYRNDKLGLTLTWSGERSFNISQTAIKIQPAINARVSRFGLTVSASVSELKFSDDYRSVTIVTPEILIPDIQINFK